MYSSNSTHTCTHYTTHTETRIHAHRHYTTCTHASRTHACSHKHTLHHAHTHTMTYCALCIPSKTQIFYHSNRNIVYALQCAYGLCAPVIYFFRATHDHMLNIIVSISFFWLYIMKLNTLVVCIASSCD